MTERERWIVYPLLFLALGAALRDKLIKSTFSERVTCEVLDCETLQARQVIQTPALRAEQITAGAISAGAMRQNGQVVLSINPQYLPQFLQRLGLLPTAPAAVQAAPIESPSAAAPAAAAPPNGP